MLNLRSKQQLKHLVDTSKDAGLTQDSGRDQQFDQRFFYHKCLAKL